MINYLGLAKKVEDFDGSEFEKYLGKEEKYIKRCISGAGRFLKGMINCTKAVYDTTDYDRETAQRIYKEYPEWAREYYCIVSRSNSSARDNRYIFLYHSDCNAVWIQHENESSNWNHTFITEDNKAEVKKLIADLYETYMKEHYNYLQKMVPRIEKDLKDMTRIYTGLMEEIDKIKEA